MATSRIWTDHKYFFYTDTSKERKCNGKEESNDDLLLVKILVPIAVIVILAVNIVFYRLYCRDRDDLRTL
jgi:hypothetical protein